MVKCESFVFGRCQESQNFVRAASERHTTTSHFLDSKCQGLLKKFKGATLFPNTALLLVVADDCFLVPPLLRRCLTNHLRYHLHLHENCSHLFTFSLQKYTNTEGPKFHLPAARDTQLPLVLAVFVFTLSDGTTASTIVY